MNRVKAILKKAPPPPKHHHWELLIPAQTKRERDVWFRAVAQVLSPNRVCFPLDDRWQQFDGVVVTPVRITSTPAERKKVVDMTAAYFDLSLVQHYTLGPDARLTRFKKRSE